MNKIVKINNHYFKIKAECLRDLGFSSFQVSKIKKTLTMKKVYDRYNK